MEWKDSMVKTGSVIEKLPDPAKSQVLNLFRQRFKFVYSSALTAASALDPMAKPTATARVVTENFIKARYQGTVQRDLLKEFENFLQHREQYSSTAIWAVEDTEHPRRWWRSRPDGGLRTLALGLFSTPATERSFKTLGIIQSKIRNRLANDAASELAKVKTHLRASCPVRYATRKPLVDFEEPTILTEGGGVDE